MTDDAAKSERLLREYLTTRKLEIGVIVLIAHDIPPWRWPHAGPESAEKVQPRYEALRAALSEGQLGATLSYSEKLDHKAQISLPDLTYFLKHAGPEWDWLRSFATRWRRYPRKSAVRQKRTTNPEQEIREHIGLVLRLGRELQHADPTMNRRQIIDQIAESGRSDSAKKPLGKLSTAHIP